MEISPYVRMQYVSEYLENEIKEISQRWAGFTVNKRALERVLKITAFPDSVEANYNEVKNALESDKKRNPQSILAKFPEETRADYEKVKEYKLKEEALDKANEGLREFVEFLEVATELKKEVDEKVNGPSTN